MSPCAPRCSYARQQQKPDTSGSITTLKRRGFKITARYRYCDHEGKLLHENVRLEFVTNGHRLKTFRQRRPDGAGGWVESIEGVPRVPYRLAELLHSGEQDVHVTEGEKDADRLSKLGLVATSITSPDNCDLSALTKRVVYIHEDNDAAGREKSEKLATALNGIALATHIVRYPDTPVKGDVSDWLDQGRGLDQLLERCEDSETATPTKARAQTIRLGRR